MALKRHDGRKVNELRAITIESGHLDAVDGSCKFCLGDTCVDVSIVGPVQSTKHSMLSKIEKAHLDVTVQSAQSTISSHELYLQQQIISLFECIILLNKYPLTTIYIQVQIICDDGCLLMAMFNAVSIALLDSGIDCKTFPISVGLAMLQKEDKNESDLQLLFDPTQKEMDCVQSFATLTFCTSLSKVSLSDSRTNSIMFSQRKTKNTQNNDSSNEAMDTEFSDMDLVYCDMKGKLKLKALAELLKQSKVACYTLQFFIKRHFVETFKSLPTIYVQADK
mmetsp:Transcript_27219/g.43059  ORF Transcript_27219/g.43059 Transcript_27219/m.43059 type:complete len:279 (-) Transcript_27219:50-886(-)|eukprot:CAMPEP_0197055740 /NCGR_PEP_ID=MMETSP1384-20130603/72341_1 /TAXON_ID=29189 /ORGANISM="Ammonia sp." /LENGTH=278 /DNA_ID=CAMNT_0042489413 /DNA_START=24 /DNA_END=860 /DNA_ORIENTATION=-